MNRTDIRWAVASRVADFLIVSGSVVIIVLMALGVIK